MADSVICILIVAWYEEPELFSISEVREAIVALRSRP